MVKILLVNILTISLASVSISACDGKGKLVEEKVSIENSTK